MIRLNMTRLHSLLLGLIVIMPPFIFAIDEIDENEPEECCICYEEMFNGESEVIYLSCNQQPGKNKYHGYHETCLTPWFARNGRKTPCPTCRAPICSDNPLEKSRLYDSVNCERSPDNPLETCYIGCHYGVLQIIWLTAKGIKDFFTSQREDRDD